MKVYHKHYHVILLMVLLESIGGRSK